MKSRRTILITGTSGLVGSAVLKALLRADKYRIVAVDLRQQPEIYSKQLLYFKKDLSRKKSWQDLLKLPVEAVIHCAAMIPGTFTSDAAEQTGRTNLRLDKLAVWYAQKKKARLIYFSSSSVYGFVTRKTCREDDQLRPLGKYAAAKAAAEKIIKEKLRHTGYYIFRISSPYGPAQRMNNVLRIFINNALSGKPLMFYGTGQRTQDFTYVEDIARAALIALAAQRSGIYNISSGRPYSMKQLAWLIKKLTGTKSQVLAAGINDPQEKYRANFSISKARHWLHWSPVFARFKGFKEFIKYLESTRS